MKEYMKNRNEYREDGKYFVEKIKSCTVDSKCIGIYHLHCSIHQRGASFYDLKEGNWVLLKDLWKDGDEAEKFWLGDRLLLLQTKQLHRQISKEECEEISEMTGRRPIPPFPHKTDMTFMVDADTIDTDLLRYSGYEILQCPYFAMGAKYNTHSVWEIDPVRRACIDAGDKNGDVITFEEFLRLLEG